MEFTPKDVEIKICLLHDVDMSEDHKSLYVIVGSHDPRFVVAEAREGFPEKMVAKLASFREALEKYDSLR